MKRPTFFVSSTIHDFRDLRAAMKFYLEEQGCKVLASEFNDFTKPLDKHSYEACLASIHAADYFVLLIGNRVGGWFDEATRTSITQREYREAYELQKSGEIKLLSFVRSEIWNMKEDRRGLITYLDSLPIDEYRKKAIANFPSKIADDADFITTFISEVARNRETSAATKTGAVPPSGNWVHSFSGFRDLIAVFESELFTSIPVEDLTIRRLLRRELREFLKRTLVKSKGGRAYSPKGWIDAFHQQHPISAAGRAAKVTALNTRAWDALSSAALNLLAVRLHPVVVPQALASSTFLAFDSDSDSYQETPAYEAIFSLQQEITSLTEGNISQALVIVFANTRNRRSQISDTIEVDTAKLADLLYLLDRWVNVVELSKSLLRHLDGCAFEPPVLRPRSPIQGMTEQIEEETPNEADIDSFVLKA